MWRSLLTASIFCFWTACATGGTSAPDATSDLGGVSSDNTPQVLVGGSNSDGTGFVDWSNSAIGSGGIPRPPIIIGPQGGQHVYVSVRTRNLFPQQVKITATVATPADCTPYDPGPSHWSVSLKSDDGWLGFQGITAFIAKPCDVKDKVVRVKVEVVDKDGLSASNFADIQPTWSGTCN